MQVSITQFRQQLFELVNKAMEGTEIWVLHKERRFKLTPEDRPAGKLSRLTRADFINSDAPKGSLLEEMTRAWESDWTDL